LATIIDIERRKSEFVGQSLLVRADPTWDCSRNHTVLGMSATGIGDDELKAIWLAADQLDPQEGS
jgi:hypothetical protein